MILSFWVCVTRNTQGTQNKFAYLCNVSRKAEGMKLNLCLQINTKVFYKFIVSLWVYLERTQSTQNNKFTISLQYLKENVKNKGGFLPADKSQSFLQKDTIILRVYVQARPNYPKNKLAISLQYHKKEMNDTLDFFMSR